MDNENIQIWTPGSTRVAKPRILARKTLEKGGSHFVTTVDKTNGKAKVIKLEAQTVETAEKLHKESIRHKEQSARGCKQREKGKPETQQKIL